MVGGGGCGCPPLLARWLLCVGRQVVRGSFEPCGAARGRQWSRCCLGGRAELFEVCYWFFRLNVCAAVAFLLFNTSRESFEKSVGNCHVAYFKKGYHADLGHRNPVLPI